MRRLILEEPSSRAAVWSFRLAAFAFVVAILGVLLARQGLDRKAALAIEGSSFSLAVLAILFGLVAMVAIWRTGYRGIWQANGGIVLSALLLTYPIYVLAEARGMPTLADITTDSKDPPLFAQSSAATMAREGRTFPTAPSVAQKAEQARLYPDLHTTDLVADPIDVDSLVRKIVKRRRWMIIETTEPRNFATGHIDCVVQTGIMGFPVDITIRIRGVGNHTLVDARSSEYPGWQERPGSNAARIEDLMSEIEEQIPPR